MTICNIPSLSPCRINSWNSLSALNSWTQNCLFLRFGWKLWKFNKRPASNKRPPRISAPSYGPASHEGSDDEEPRIKDVLNNLSRAVSRKTASELLHSTATSKDILFWTPRGQLLPNQRIIPDINISELVDCVLLSQNEDVAKPRAVNTFLDGLAKLRVNKNLIKNKKLLSDLLEKEQAYNDNESEETSDGDSSDNGEDLEETASGTNSEQQESERDSNCSEQEAESSNDVEHTYSKIQRKVKAPCQHCESSNVSPTMVVIYLWHEDCRNCPICDHEIPSKQKNVKDNHSMSRRWFSPTS